MAKILFVIPEIQGRYGVPSTPHVGVAYLAAYVMSQGHEALVLDLRVQRMSDVDLLAEVRRCHPDFLGVTSTSFGYRRVYELVERLVGTGIPVIYGGPHVSTIQEKVFEGCTPYAAICGEGEEKLARLLDGDDRRTIPGIIFREVTGELVATPPAEGIRDLDSLPFPAYELSPLSLYSERKIPLTTSRECPYSCTYCNVKLVMGKGFRARSPENVVDEIQRWCDRGYRLFGINDDTFTTDMARAYRICELIIQRKLDIKFELRTGIRVDKVSEDLLRIMKMAGCIFLAYGIESIDPEVLKMSKKGITFEQVDRAISLAEKVGIPYSGFFIIGLPGDTFAKFSKLLAYATTKNFNEIRFYNLEPYPNTEVFDWVKEHGRFFAEPEEYLNNASRVQGEPIFDTPEFPAEERARAYGLGEAMVVRKLIEKTIGPTLGAPFSLLCKYDVFRKVILDAGFKLAPLIRRRHTK